MHRTFRRSSVRFAGALVSLICLLVAGAASASADETPLPDLTGRWVMVQHLSTYAVLPIVGEIYLTTTIGLFSDVTQTGSAVALRDAYCFTDVDVTSILFGTAIPDATMQSLRPDPRLAEIVSDGEALRFVQEWHTEVRGAELDDPINDPLPAYPSDPRLVDQDEDGKIGITIPAEIIGLLEGETYAVQRFRYRLSGDFVDDDTIVGLVEWTTEQTIVSATDALFFMPFTQVTDPDPERHRFAMVRVDETWDCETAREQLETLLALLPPLPESVQEESLGAEPAAEEPATP